MPNNIESQKPAVSETTGIANFRELVNYRNTTNKGYVRLISDDNGGFRVEKFNNKVDVPLCFRSNTSAEHNRSVRQKLAEALESDLHFLGSEEAEEIRNLILKPKGGAGARAEAGPGVDGTALSRRELMGILQAHDAHFNTREGRRRILDGLYRDAMSRVDSDEYRDFKTQEDFEKAKEQFVKKFLVPLEPRGGKGFVFRDSDFLVHDNTDLLSEVENEDFSKIEGVFRQYITGLKARLDAAVPRANAEAKCIDLVAAAAAKGETESAFGFSVTGEDHNSLRDSLLEYLGSADDIGVRDQLMEHLDAVGENGRGAGSDARGLILSLFVGRALPAVLQNAVANVRGVVGEGGSGDDRIRKAAADAIDIDKVVTAARRFVNEVSAQIINGRYGLGEVNDEIEKQNHGVVNEDGMAKSGAKMRLFAYSERSAVGAAIRGEQGSVPTQRLRKYVYDFCAGQFGDGLDDGGMREAKTLDNKALETYGDKEAVAYMKDCIDHWGLEDVAVRGLCSKMMPNIMRKGGDFKKSAGKVSNALDSYADFVDGNGKYIAAATIREVESRLAAMVGENAFPKDDAETFRRYFEGSVKKAMDRAVGRFFERMPDDDFEGSDGESVIRNLKLLEDLFDEERSVAVGEMNGILDAAGAICRSEPQGCRSLLDFKSRVREFVDTLEKDDAGRLDVAGKCSVPELSEPLERLYLQTLAQEVQPGSGELAEGTGEKVRGTFASKAKSLIEDVNGLSARLDRQLKGFLEEGARKALAADGNDPYGKLGASECKAVAGSVADDVLKPLEDEVRAFKRRFLTDRETSVRKSGDADMAMEFLRDAGIDVAFSRENIGSVYAPVLKAREQKVDEWLEEIRADDKQDALVREAQWHFMHTEPSSEAFGAISRDKDVALPYDERDRILERFMRDSLPAALDRAGKFRQLYADDPFDSVRDDVCAAALRRAKNFVAFYNEFAGMVARNKVIAKFAYSYQNAQVKNPEVYESVGKKMMFDFVYDKCASADLPADSAGVRRIFDEFQKSLDEEWGKYDKYLDDFDKVIVDGYKALEAAGASQDDVKYIGEELLKTSMHARARHAIVREFDEPGVVPNPEDIRKYAEERARDLLGGIEKALKGVDFTNDETLGGALYKTSNLKEFANDGNFMSAARKAVQSVLGDKADLVAAARRQAIDHAVYYGDDTAVKELEAVVGEALVGVKREIIKNEIEKLIYEFAHEDLRATIDGNQSAYRKEAAINISDLTSLYNRAYERVRDIALNDDLESLLPMSMKELRMALRAKYAEQMNSPAVGDNFANFDRIARERVGMLDRISNLVKQDEGEMKPYLADAIAAHFKVKDGKIVSVSSESMDDFKNAYRFLSDNLAERMYPLLDEVLAKLSGEQAQGNVKSRLKSLDKDEIEGVIRSEALEAVKALDKYVKWLGAIKTDHYDEAHELREWIRKQPPVHGK